MSTVQQHRGAGFLIEDPAPEDVLTPEDMNEEQRMMMRAIEDFAKKEVHPVVAEVENRNWDVIGPLFKKAADMGIFMAEVPEEYGGLGLSVLAIAGMNESRSYLGPLASTVFAHQGIGTLPLINFGTRDQIDRYLQKCMNGDLMACFALTEPSSGSDAMNIKTTAVLSEDGTHYVVNGSKQFITNAGWAGLFILFAKVDGEAFSAFLLDGDTPGLTVGENEKLLGLKGSSVCGLTLEDVKIPVGNLLGEVGKGHKVALCTLNLGRLKMSANCAGSSKKVLECATQYASERHQFGKPIAEFGLMQTKIAEMAARTYAAESVAYRTAGMVYQAIEAMGEEARQSIDTKLKVLTEFSIECAFAKVFGAETFNAAADEALQIHGGYGYSEEYKPAQYYRDSRITRIYEGTSEICRMTAMKAILKRSGASGLDIASVVDGLVPPDRSDSGEGRGKDLSAIREQVCDFKKLFLHLYGRLMDSVGAESILDDEHQQYLGSLATIAIETYAAESTVLRVLKLSSGRSSDETALPEALARLFFERAGDIIRRESSEILGSLYEAGDLRKELHAVQGWLPLPAGRNGLRAHIARSIVERRGALPSYTN